MDSTEIMENSGISGADQKKPIEVLPDKKITRNGRDILAIDWHGHILYTLDGYCIHEDDSGNILQKIKVEDYGG